MSQVLLSRLSSSLALRSRSLMQYNKTSRLFSSTSPYLALFCIETESSICGGGSVGDIFLFDVAKEELVRVTDKTLPKELLNAKMVGSSHGWDFHRDGHDLYIADIMNPLASKTDPTIIHLPTVTAISHYSCQTELVSNVAMSSPPPPPSQQEDDDDWVVGIKFLGDQLSLCRPSRDLRWTNISIPFQTLQNSNLFFSKRDQTFNLSVPGGNNLCSWDLQFHKDNSPKFYELLFHNLPNLPQSMWELLASCHREDYWVESPSGESFLVKWYSLVFHESTSSTPMVFREEDSKEEGRRNMCYTEDIGDMCIFLSDSEAFCVPASSCPGLKPNSIYFSGHSLFAVYDLTTKSMRHFQHPEGLRKDIPFLSYWLPPFSV
ncbi:hypothetical protein N665_0116s0045 [Sinapis alba]|nr:hypothetical protein N665_0116s0045 [Sinapis alba]